MKNPTCLRFLAAFLLAALSSCGTPIDNGPAPTKTLALDDYVLTGHYTAGDVTFNLHVKAVPPAEKGDNEIVLLSGPVSPTAVPDALAQRLNARNGDIVLKSTEAGDFVVDLPFRAQVKEEDGWKTVDFTPANANIRQLVLEGWPDDAKVDLPDASQAVHKDGRITANLPASGHVVLRWKDALPEAAGKLFFSAEGAVMDTVAPGILRQIDQFNLNILQGKLDHIDLDLSGDGEVTHVDGPGILNWAVAPGAVAGQRRLSVQLNAPHTGQYTLAVQLETPLAALPTTATPPRLVPVGASTYGGRLRVQNEGTVRLEVNNPKGLSQISPDQFPVARSANVPAPTQAFAYRFADIGYSYTVQADNVLSEFTTNSIIAYHLGDNDASIEAEIELDIREAPLRELNIIGPADWAVAGLQAPYLADHFVTPAGDGRAQLRLVFTQPLMGRQVVRLRLERNANPTPSTATPAAGTVAPATEWAVPTLIVKDAKSARGFVGVTSDASLRLTPTTIDGLKDAAAAFPVKLDNLQAAWRFTDEVWSATLKVEHLASSVQADDLHIFSVGEGMVLGSTVMNFNIAGAPVSVFRLQNTGNYTQVEFTGRYHLDWTQTGDVIEVHLDHPVSGPYTLLATYQLPFKSSGDTLPFTGLRPLDVQSEQGHVLIASSYPFSLIEPKTLTGLTRLETAEIPVEERLLCDSPILACYEYSARPFEAMLQLQPLTSGGTVDQVIDIGELSTRVSSTGEVVTTARYLLKSKGHDYLSLSLPTDAKLWNVAVAGKTVVPVSDKNAAGTTSQNILVPLPRQGDPNVPLLVELKYAAAAKEASRVTVDAPTIHAPVLATDWQLSADDDRRLVAVDSAPTAETPHLSGLGWLTQTVMGKPAHLQPPIVPMFLRWRKPPQEGMDHQQTFFAGLALALGGLVCLRGVRLKNIFCKTLGGGAGLALVLAGVVLLAQLGRRSAHDTDQVDLAHDVHLSIPITEADHPLTFTFINEAAPATTAAQPVQLTAWLLLPGIILLLIGLLGIRGVIWQMAGSLLILAGTLDLPQGPLWFCATLALAFAGAALAALRNLRGKRSLPIPPVGGVSAVTTAALIGLLWIGSTLNTKAANAPATENYTVQSGETLAAIAARYHTTAADLRTLNHMAAAQRITVGQVIMVPMIDNNANNATSTYTPADNPYIPGPNAGFVLSITQNGTVKDGFVHIDADLTWRAEKGNQLTILRSSAVLTAFKNDQSHVTMANVGNAGYVITASEAGIYKVSFTYEIHAAEEKNTAGNVAAANVVLPTPGGLVNLVTLDLGQADLDATSVNAVSLHMATSADGHPHMTASFSSGSSPVLHWSPRARDLSTEKPVYYADWKQLYAPAAGLVDGEHEVHVRLAQGEIKELTFNVPVNLTISEVDAQGLATWRFDPDKHTLTAYFEPALKNAFDVVIHSQASAAPLPYTTDLSLIRLEGAANDTGMLAAATGQEVELGNVTAKGLATINLDDFPANVVRAATPQGESYTVRRAYSYGATDASLQAEALAVEPDVRMESTQTLSLGEDRVVLGAHLKVAVNRAGIFKLSFPLPPGMDLETLTGDQLSQWTQSGTGDDRIITMNLKGKTIGNLTFDVSLSGPGISARQDWSAPRLVLREASKQTGQLVITPELGLRPQNLRPVNLSQIPPNDAQIKTEGALVFRILQGDWTLAFNIEKIAPRVQVDGLQDVTVREGSTEVHANLNYQIDNSGVRELRLQLPTGAIGVHISGTQVSDSLPIDGQPDQWLVRLQRRSIGELSLTVAYQLPPAGADNNLSIAGLRTLDTDLQRGFIDLRSRGRIETRVTTPPAALLSADWESVPANLRHDLDSDAPSQIFRASDPNFTLPVVVARHDAAKVLPARVVSASLRSLVSPDGQLLTSVTVQLFPGDKRNLNVKLPADSKFWFAFVNDKGVTPSLDNQDKTVILLPLEPNPIASEPATVEFLYQQKAPTTGVWSQTELTGPRIDLPLENISWQLYLPETWKVSQWSTPWQKSDAVSAIASGNGHTLDDYLAEENNRLNQQNAKADVFLKQGNKLLQEGQQMQARELFSNAYQISQRDSAFNEDARVQWQNLRETQAMVSLNNGINTFSNNSQNGQSAAINGGPAPLMSQQSQINPVLSQNELLNFTDQQARVVLSANPADENAVLAKLAHSLVQQQADTLPHPVAIHATLPERGTVYEFTQSILVNPDADLTLKLTAGPLARPVSWAGLGALVALGAFVAAAFKISRKPNTV